MVANRKTDYFLNNRIEELHTYSLCVESREIFLEGQISEDDPGVDYVMAYNAIKNIRFLENISSQDIIIHHYNIGGHCDAGFAIYDAIKNSKCHMKIVCHGICASMGTIITQAADTRLCMPNCYFLLHEGGLDTGSVTHKEGVAYIELDKYIRNKMVDIYTKSMKDAEKFSGYTEARIKKYLQDKFDRKSDWYLKPEEVKEHGLVDEIIGVTKYKNLAEAIDV